MRFLRRNEPRDPQLFAISKVMPDRVLDERFPQRRGVGSGRWREFKTSQLARMHLLTLIKGLRSFNRLCQELPHNLDFRRFCRLAPKQAPPTASCLAKFRAAFGCEGWRVLHRILLRALWQLAPASAAGIVVVDATDFPAAVRRTRKKRAICVSSNG